jgi:hypothetical protein
VAFRQYTQCVDIQNFDPGNPLAGAALLGLYVTLAPGLFTALLIIAGVASWTCLLILAEVYLCATVVGYCYWFLYRRLICIPAPPENPADSAGDHLVVGTLINILPPDPVFDNDYSIGILPQPNPIGASPSEVQGKEPYGYLVTNQPVTKNYPLEFTGHPEHDTDPNKCPVDQRTSEVLHCEFEGRGVYDLYIASRVALAVAVVTLFLCFLGVPWWVTLILALIGLALLALGVLLGHWDKGNPNDVDPNIGELHTNQCDHTGADTLVVKGRWVYDSGHRFPLVNYIPFLQDQQSGGWNELHPITFCCKANGDFGDVVLLRKRWQTAIDDATSPATLASQALPQNQWQVHPLIDGCLPSIII